MPKTLPDDACPQCGTTMVEHRAEIGLVVHAEEILVPDVPHLCCPKCGEVVLRFEDSKYLSQQGNALYLARHPEEGIAIHPDDDLVHRALTVALALPQGFGIDMFGGMLRIYPLENGAYQVEEEEVTKRPTTPPCTVDLGVYASPADAVARFLQRRRERRLGFDFERV